LLALVVLVLVAGCGSRNDTPSVDAGSPASAPTGSQVNAPHPEPSAPSSPNVDVSGITRADGGKNVAELYAERDQLAGTKVVVRGKVVKTNAGIMGRNWLHVRDGSGADGANDLTVTTTGVPPQVGDTVVVSGPLSVNMDYGMGYEYGVIIEHAEVTVESTTH
jgi:hypothetical protein